MRFPHCVLLVLAVTLVLSQESAQASRSRAQSQPKQTPAAADQPFSEAVAESLLSALSEAILGQDQAAALALFDQDRMPDYSDFAERVGAILRQYESFRVNYHLVQTFEETGQNLAIVEFTLEAFPASDAGLPIRRSAQLRFSFTRGEKSWKISDVQPRDFFAQF
jgi:hypothetical protein